MSTFRVLSRTCCNGIHNVVKYVCAQSGVTVVVADVDGPIVHGYLTFATEAKSDEGLPHTLEHLVFMGSNRFPWKGVLDKVANRCFASGTNAWTATDHTCYTMSTAGVDGFLKLLPIYINHLLDPMLTDSQFATEVHHIDGEGNDGGVVYSEMQEHEQQLQNVTRLRLKTLKYPENSGYRYETGGRLVPLRTTCSNEKVIQFHRDFYTPRNLCIFVSGTIDHNALLECIHKEITSHPMEGVSSNWQKPFRTDIPALCSSVTERLRAPSDDESSGLVLISWMGPKAEDKRGFAALTVLNDYLATSVVSPFQKHFVQLEQPLCSDVSFDGEVQTVTEMTVSFDGVGIENLDRIAADCRRLLDNLCSGVEPFDLQRLRDNLKQSILLELEQTESSPSDKVSHEVIGDFLYGDTTEHFENELNSITFKKQFLEEPEDFWLNLLRQYYGKDANSITIIGEPCEELIEAHVKSEAKRLEERKTELGTEKLNDLAAKLNEFIKANEAAQPTQAFLDENQVNSLSGIHHITLNQSSNLCPPDSDTNPHFALNKLPFRTVLVDGKTQFANLRLVFDSSHLSAPMRSLLLLLAQLLFMSPMKNQSDDVVTPYQDIVKQLDKELVDYKMNVGFSSSFSQYVTLAVKVPCSEYAKACHWLSRLMHDVVFESERTIVAIKRILNGLAEQKRDANDMNEMILRMTANVTDSNDQLFCGIRLEKYLNQLLKELNKDPKKVTSSLERLYTSLFSVDSIRVAHVSADTALIAKHCADPQAELLAVVRDYKQNESPSKRACLSEPGAPVWPLNGVVNQHRFYTVGSSESSFVRVLLPAKPDLESVEYAALIVALEYLSMCEGPLWCGVRGKGLAYGAGLNTVKDCGIMLQLYRCSQPVEAYEQTRNIITELCASDKNQFDVSDVESAKRSLIYMLVMHVDTVPAASKETLITHIRMLPQDFVKQTCERVFAVTPSQVHQAAVKYLPDLMNPEKTVTSIVAHPNHKKKIMSGFERLGIKPSPFNLSAAQKFEHLMAM